MQGFDADLPFRAAHSKDALQVIMWLWISAFLPMLQDEASLMITKEGTDLKDQEGGRLYEPT